MILVERNTTLFGGAHLARQLLRLHFLVHENDKLPKHYLEITLFSLANWAFGPVV